MSTTTEPQADYAWGFFIRPLAVTTATRSAALPDLPTVGDFVPGYEASSWQGIGTPKGTPSEVTETLNKEINAALVDANFKARLADLGGMALPGSPADFRILIAEELKSGQRWSNSPAPSPLDFGSYQIPNLSDRRLCRCDVRFGSILLKKSKTSRQQNFAMRPSKSNLRKPRPCKDLTEATRRKSD